MMGFKRLVIFLFSFLPISASQKVCSFGFPELFRKTVEFQGRISGTTFTIKARSDHPIESNATRLFLRDPLQKKLLRTDFSNLNVLDIGANVGTYTLIFCNQGARHVFAVEPGPLVHVLNSNVANNSLGDKVSVSNLGISDTARSMYWYEDLNNLGNAHLYQKNVVLDERSTLDKIGKPVVCETLDSFWIRHEKPRIDFIKLDVEGMELDVLRSGKGLLSALKPILLVETHKENQRQNLQIHEYLQKFGYQNECANASNNWAALAKLPNDTLFQYKVCHRGLDGI